ncbi:MAG: hypothetical protein QN209_03295 [Armatimonadota bacterium]|nr:hypothetical protein [Armatimonadota bacterium]
MRGGQRGAALASAMVVVFLLTVVVTALVLATMGETVHALDQRRGSQALYLAEAGAYRALAELRRRLSADLDAAVRSADRALLRGSCVANRSWEVIAAYGGPGWVDEDAAAPGTRRAYLDVGTSSAPVHVRAADGEALGSFYARIYVRPADNGLPPAANTCTSGSEEAYRMWFDYFIVATGGAGNAARTVCLKNPGNLAGCGAWLGTRSPGSAAFDTPPPNHGFQLLIVAASSDDGAPGGYAAPRFPRLSPDVLYDRPLWEELAHW